jgi:hypothetical protein
MRRSSGLFPEQTGERSLPSHYAMLLIRPYAAPGQDALHRLPPTASWWDADRLQGPIVRLPRLHPHVGKVAEGQERGAADNRQKPVCPLGGRSHGLVSDQPASAHKRPARLAVGGPQRALRLLWRHGKHSAATGVLPPSRADLDFNAFLARHPLCPTESHPATKKRRINASILPNHARCTKSDRLLAWPLYPRRCGTSGRPGRVRTSTARCRRGSPAPASLPFRPAH